MLKNFESLIVYQIFFWTALFLASVLLVLALQLGRRVWLRGIEVGRDAQIQSETERLVTALLGNKAFDDVILDEAVAASSMETNVQILRSIRGSEHDRLLCSIERTNKLSATSRAASKGRLVRRLDALRILEAARCGQSVAALHNMLRSDRSVELRLRAALILADFGEQLEPALIESALRLSPAKFSTPHRALFREIAREHVTVVNALYASAKSATLKAMLTEALGSDESMSSAELIKRRAFNSEVVVRVAALRAATKMGHPLALNWVRPLFVDDRPSVRIAALDTFSKLGDRDDVHELAIFSGESDSLVKATAVRTAMHMGSKKHANNWRFAA